MIGYGGVISLPSGPLVGNEHAVVGNLVGSWIDLHELMQLHAAGRIVLKTEMHPLESVNGFFEDFGMAHPAFRTTPERAIKNMPKRITVFRVFSIRAAPVFH